MMYDEVTYYDVGIDEDISYWVDVTEEYQSPEEMAEFIIEEMEELRTHLLEPRYVSVDEAADQLKECMDVMFTILAYCKRRGWDWRGAFDELIEENFSKIDPETDMPYVVNKTTGKIGKPENMYRADMRQYIQTMVQFYYVIIVFVLLLFIEYHIDLFTFL